MAKLHFQAFALPYIFHISIRNPKLSNFVLNGNCLSKGTLIFDKSGMFFFKINFGQATPVS